LDKGAKSGLWTLLGVGLDMGGILVRGEEILQFNSVAELKLNHPSVSERGLVDSVGALLEGGVDFNDLASNRGVNISGGLNGFNSGNRGSLLQVLIDICTIG